MLKKNMILLYKKIILDILDKLMAYIRKDKNLNFKRKY